MSEETTKAAVYRVTGAAAEVLTLEKVRIPDPGPGCVRVRMSYSGINPTDVKTRAGLTMRPISDFQIPHQDGSGVIEAVGAGVDAARVGERVWLMLAAFENRYGTASGLSVVPADRARSLPDTVELALGATLGVPAVTAAYCLAGNQSSVDRTVLVHGGAGGVGRCAIQLAKASGATVVASASSPAKAAIATAAGADLVVNYRDPSAADMILSSVGAVDRIVEVNLPTNLDLDIQVSRVGTVVVVYAADGDDPILPRRQLMTAGLNLQFMLLYSLPQQELLRAVATVERALADGHLTMPPVEFFPLDHVAAAHQAQESGPSGRIIVDVGDLP